MTILVPLALWGWIPVVVAIFAFLPPRKAVITTFILAWLFLPVYAYNISGLPNYTKVTATCVGTILGVVCYDTQRLISFKFHCFDIPLLIWCCLPIASSLSNGLGLYDGFSTALNYFTLWGLPFFIGRMYFNTLGGLRELAIGIFIGGLVYIPFCLYEIRMSPQLHNIVYGVHQHSFGQTVRFGGYRPMVFMEHGLAVGLWMAASFLVGIWLKISSALKTKWILAIKLLLALLFGTTVFCKSLGSIVLLVIGMLVLLSLKWLRNFLPIFGLLIIAPVYITIRCADVWSGAELIQLVERYISSDRARSLQFRIDNEEALKRKALQRPLFGWGGWDRSTVYINERRLVADSLWIKALGKNGLLGLITLTLFLLLPVLRLWQNFRPGLWVNSTVAPAASLAVLVNLYMLDNLLNNMENPIFLLAAGGLTGLNREDIPSQAQPVKKTVFDPSPWRSTNPPALLQVS